MRSSFCLAFFGGVLALAGPALADDEAYCALLREPTYQAEAHLRQARCFRSGEDDATRFYQCESGNGGAASFSGNWFVYRGHFEGAFDPRQRTRDCGVTPQRAYQSWNNPMVADIHRAGTRTVIVLRSPLPLPDEKDFSSLIYIIGDASVESGLRALPDYPDGVGLNLPSSEARIAGVDLTTARPAALEAALVERGAQRLAFDCISPDDAAIEDCLIGDLTTTYPDASVAAKEVKASFVLGRVLSTSYVFAGEEDYLTFVAALDDRYGASNRTSGERGCTVRRWTAGGVDITGEYCSRDDAKIIFDNNAVVNLLGFYTADINGFIDGMKADDQPARPRGDMF